MDVETTDCCLRRSQRFASAEVGCKGQERKKGTPHFLSVCKSHWKVASKHVTLRASVARLGSRRKNDKDMRSVYNLFNPWVIATRMCVALSLVQQSLDGICAITTPAIIHTRFKSGQLVYGVTQLLAETSQSLV